MERSGKSSQAMLESLQAWCTDAERSGIATLDECSVIAAPYTVDGQIVGSVGVIGPTRMAYERVIPIVDITARLLSSALSNQQNY